MLYTIAKYDSMVSKSILGTVETKDTLLFGSQTRTGITCAIYRSALFIIIQDPLSSCYDQAIARQEADLYTHERTSECNYSIATTITN